MPEGDLHTVQRGPLGVPASGVEGHRRARPEAPFPSSELLELVPFPARASVSTGFAPRGAGVEPGGPGYPFDLVEGGRVAPPEVAALYDQAVAANRDAGAPLPWDRLKPLPDALDGAVAQVMTFLAENELSALYVPAHFVPRIHPAFAEVSMFLASQMSDEARHLDSFLKRARATRAVGVSSATTSRSLLFLLTLSDFTEASFLLSVLGEGTFLDLLRFVEEHAPDEVTAEVARRARADETRHVHFGMAHVRHALANVPGTAARLEAAVGRRATAMAGASGVPAPIQDALTILAAGGDAPQGIARGHRAFRELLEVMDASRVRRLAAMGFSQDQAHRLSGLHTPNFM